MIGIRSVGRRDRNANADADNNLMAVEIEGGAGRFDEARRKGDRIIRLAQLRV